MEDGVASRRRPHQPGEVGDVDLAEGDVEAVRGDGVDDDHPVPGRRQPIDDV